MSSKIRTLQAQLKFTGSYKNNNNNTNNNNNKKKKKKKKKKNVYVLMWYHGLITYLQTLIP